MKRLSPVQLVVLLGLLLATPVPALRYSRNFRFVPNVASTIVLTEGEMAPGPEGQPPSELSLNGVLTLAEAFPRSGDEFLNVVFANEFNLESIGYPAPGMGDLSKDPAVCCTDALFSQGVCGSAGRGGIIRSPPPSGVEAAKVMSIAVSGGLTPVNASFTVKRQGVQYIIANLCAGSTDISSANLAAEWIFKGSDGFLPLALWNDMVFNSVMAVCVGIFLLVLAAVLVYQRQHFILLQGMLLIVAAVALSQHVAWALTLTEHNNSGDQLCCPVPAGLFIASILTALKETVALSMLLTVCLGFGTVVPNLPHRLSLAVAILALFFFGFSVTLRVSLLASSGSIEGQQQSFVWFVPAVLLNAAFLAWIAGALRNTTQNLTARAQQRKMEMFNALLGAFAVCLFFIVVIALIDVATEFGLFELPSAMAAVRNNVWDTVYFLMLLAVTVIWRPGERTAALSIYAEALDSEQQADEMDEDDGNDDDQEQRGTAGEEGASGDPAAPDGSARAEPPSATSGQEAEVTEIELTAVREAVEPPEMPGGISRAPAEPAHSPVV